MKSYFDDRMIRTAPDGEKWVLQERWLRITQNPIAPSYPETGDEIELVNHCLIPDGEYIVETVTEFEPGISHDEDGRDIRISLLGVGRDFNGPNIRSAMKGQRASDQEPGKLGWAKRIFGL